MHASGVHAHAAGSEAPGAAPLTGPSQLSAWRADKQLARGDSAALAGMHAQDAWWAAHSNESLQAMHLDVSTEQEVVGAEHPMHALFESLQTRPQAAGRPQTPAEAATEQPAPVQTSERAYLPLPACQPSNCACPLPLEPSEIFYTVSLLHAHRAQSFWGPKPRRNGSNACHCAYSSAGYLSLIHI